MNDHRSHAVSIIIAALFLPVLYVASYLALADHRRGTMGNLNPNYRIGDEEVRQFYRPMEWLDRKLRPTRWLPVG